MLCSHGDWVGDMLATRCRDSTPRKNKQFSWSWASMTAQVAHDWKDGEDSTMGPSRAVGYLKAGRFRAILVVVKEAVRNEKKNGNEAQKWLYISLPFNR